MQNLAPRFRKISAPGLILYAFTISFACIDWVMSLDPHWVSTIFGFIIIVGECLSAMCLMVILETHPLSRRTDGVVAETERGARPRQADAYVHHAARLFQLLAVADHLGRQPADGNSLLPAPP